TLIAQRDHARTWASVGLHPGQPALVSDRCIVIGDAVRLTLDPCLPWRQPPWPGALPPRALDDVRRVIARRMRLESPPESFARIVCRQDQDADETTLARIARPRLAQFESWLRDDAQHEEVSAAAIRDLIGLGHGLTPSGDDFLVGALALLDALDERQAHAALAHAVTALPHELTSALSECLLMTAAAGHFGE